MFEIDAEIFAVGKWNGMEFTLEDLMDFANNFHKLAEVHKVPLKFGHNDEQPLTDGQPALGFVSDVWVDKGKGKLMAKFTDVPEIVYEAIKAGRYRNVSIEADFGVEHKGEFYANVLSGVALLGADIPAVNTLADLKAYMGRDEGLRFSKRAVFTAISNQPKRKEGNMPTIEELEAKVEALTKQLQAKADKDAEERAKFAREKAEFEQAKKAAEEEAAKAAFEREKADLTETLEKLVKAEAITPAKRDKLLAEFSRETAEQVKFAVNVLSEGVDLKAAPPKDEQGRNKQSTSDDDDDKAAKFDREVRKFMRENKVPYGQAMLSVARENPELARGWADFNEEDVA